MSESMHSVIFLQRKSGGSFSKLMKWENRRIALLLWYDDFHHYQGFSSSDLLLLPGHTNSETPPCIFCHHLIPPHFIMSCLELQFLHLQHSICTVKHFAHAQLALLELVFCFFFLWDLTISWWCQRGMKLVNFFMSAHLDSFALWVFLSSSRHSGCTKFQAKSGFCVLKSCFVSWNAMVHHAHLLGISSVKDQSHRPHPAHTACFSVPSCCCSVCWLW